MIIIKIIICVSICFLCFFAGKVFSDDLKNKIDFINEKILYLSKLENEVIYSAKNIKYEAEEIIRCKNDVEEFCDDIISKMVIRIENCNSVDDAACEIRNTKNRLIEFKEQKQEEYRPKITATPKIGLVIGMIVAVIVI